MKRVKRGRAPSAMGAAGGAFAVIFGIIWTVAAIGMGAPWFFALFGVCFIGMAAAGALYNFKNATGKERYSEFDIVDEYEEGDPSDAWVRDEEPAYCEMPENSADSGDADFAGGKEINFCPYCGEPVENKAYRFCQKCGERIR